LNFIESSKSIGKSRVNNEKYRIAFTGHSAHHKGWDLFELLSRHVASRNDFECFHLGNGPKSTYIDFIRVDSVNGNSNMQSALLSNEIDIVFQWSLWPETFGLVTAEALAAGCLVITNPGSGNLKHMATQYSRGLVFESFEQLIIDHDSGELKAEVSRRKKAIESTSLDLNWNSFVDLTGKK
jgi:glycosyltransferase involved in cell wall biosynthesis